MGDLLNSRAYRFTSSFVTTFKTGGTHGIHCGSLSLKQPLESLDSANRQGFPENFATYASLLRECGKRKALAEGKRLHLHVIKQGLNTDVFLGNQLILMYIKCGSNMDAREVFDNMPVRNMVSWNSMIGGYARHGNGDEVFRLFRQMQQEGVNPDKITFIGMLNACVKPETLALGKLIHACIIYGRVESRVTLGNALLNMYGKCGRIEVAHGLFTNMPERDVVSWNAMITAYAQHGHVKEAFRLFQQMQLQGVKPDNVTFINILNACANSETLELGKLVHAYIVDGRFMLDVIVRTALVSMYIKCGSIEDARRTFDNISERDVVSWNVMIGGCSRCGHSLEAFKLFRQMQQEGTKPDRVTLINMLSPCASPEALSLGKLVHAFIVNRRMESDVVIGNALVNMYWKCGGIQDAGNMFHRLTQRDVISWNAMITAYAQHGYFKKAFKVFLQMQQKGVKPNKVTFLSILNACASPEALALGKQVHDHIGDAQFELDIGTALVNMYGRCGGIEDARTIFDKMPRRDMVLWTTMIAVYAQHGYGNEALHIFQQMELEGLKPDNVTLISVLNACSHAGLLDEALYYFCSMSSNYNITPTVEHYNCMLDLLGRAGLLDEAEDFINNMPCQPDAVIWMTLLGSCRIHGSIDQGRHAAEHAVQLDPESSPPYVALSNIYAAVSRWNDVEIVRKLMTDRSVKQEAGYNWIGVNNMTHGFLVRDISHPQTMEIYAQLESLS